MTYEDALSYIHSVQWKGSRPGLERIRVLMDSLGNPQDHLKFIHVAGTNGKGSVCAMTESILRKAGLKTGLFTSPYILDFCERMAVDSIPISHEELAEITEYVRPFADRMTDSPTEFELITAIAFEYFFRNRCDIVVLEVGMGGRLDSTNIIQTSVACVITGIALDHTEYLGDTIEKIAFEKAGILKPGIPAVYGGKDRTALKVIRQKQKEMNAPLKTVRHERIRLKKTDLSGSVFDYKRRKDIRISLPGVYQPENAATVLELFSLLRKEYPGLFGFKTVRAGLKEAQWKGRFELLLADPPVISDGSHNPDGVSAAARSLAAIFPGQQFRFVTGVMKDKDYPVMVRSLSPLAKEVYTISPDNPRALSAESLAGTYRENGVEKVYPCRNAREALGRALELSKKDGVPVVCLGSLYMYAEVHDVISQLKKCPEP
ncbi:MAG: bifunctional folylpolyglutamate synthase/dihydrofolate synthase [Clostridia bacterium]|nr:bifunctional folylpolyglutamate synthase/dihydrofolate synthase [Clostridia bacterium]